MKQGSCEIWAWPTPSGVRSGMGTYKALPVTSTGCPTPPTPNPLSIGSSQRSSCRPQFWRVLSTKSGVWVCSYLILWLPSCLVRQLRLWPQVGVDMTVGLCMNCSLARLHGKPISSSPLNKELSMDKERVSQPPSLRKICPILIRCGPSTDISFS